jgi:hypothetical protein
MTKVEDSVSSGTSKKAITNKKSEAPAFAQAMHFYNMPLKN